MRKLLARLRRLAQPPEPAAAMAAELRQRFAIYQSCRLRGISPEKFADALLAKIGSADAAAEGYASDELDRQRDLSIQFHWGHNHDFGAFKLAGRMGNRHIEVLANFLTLFPVSLESFQGKEVFDIGCWTGGTALLLAALGSRVVAIEEVRKYAETAAFLARSFGLEGRLTVHALSLYQCRGPEFHDRFDLAHCPGVIYHLSDPVLALRILFNSLRVGGELLLESAGINTAEPLCRFWGNKPVQGDARSGWAWFHPSPSALARMMREAGFDQVQALWHAGARRVYAYGKKTAQVGICRAGLSVRDIR